MIELAKEFWLFLRVRKKWWLAPIVLVLGLMGLLIMATQGSALAPFIYTLFYFSGAPGHQCGRPDG